jgi:prepilin-type N-terminal cleavage/methylation domain-containing protein
MRLNYTLQRNLGRKRIAAIGFSLIEVMIACGVFFLCIFAILELVSTLLRNAGRLRHVEVDAGLVAAQLYKTNRLTEGTESGDFGTAFKGYSWNTDTREAATNGLWEVDIVVNKQGLRDPVDQMTVWVYSPQSSQQLLNQTAESATRRRGVFRFQCSRERLGFTLIEIMIAISILALILTAIYSSWTAILRSKKVAIDSTAAVQRARISLRILEDSLASAQCFVRNKVYYGFSYDGGSEGSLSFVARLSESFPRSGKFGGLDVRRLTFSVEAGPESSDQLVLRQSPIVCDIDKDEKDNPLILAKNVKEFQMQFWDQKLNDWTDEWTDTNALPKLVMVSLKLGDNPHSSQVTEEITKIISVAANAVQPGWQPMVAPMSTPNQPGQPGSTTSPLPGQAQPTGVQPIPSGSLPR